MFTVNPGVLLSAGPINALWRSPGFSAPARFLARVVLPGHTHVSGHWQWPEAHLPRFYMVRCGL